MAKLTIRGGKFLQTMYQGYIDINHIVTIDSESPNFTKICYEIGSNIKNATIDSPLQDVMNLLEKECSNTKHIKKWK
jgi:hypothetical protein